MATSVKISTRIRNWLKRYERPISSISLVGGFVFDAVTLRHVDAFWENIWVVGHLLIVGICIVLLNRANSKMSNNEDVPNIHAIASTRATDPGTYHFWLVNILQFFFGGILSTYLVFYFRSGSIAVDWPFLLILALAFWANESFKKHYVRMSLQITLFYMSILAFAIFIIPVLIHQIGTWVFILSGIVSLVVIYFFLRIIKFFAPYSFSRERGVTLFLIGIVFVIVNVLYITNIIPPIPLSLKDAGVYHSLIKNKEGDYVVTAEPWSWKNLLTFYDDIHLTADQNVYVYASVYAPSFLNTTIVHHYEWYDDATSTWIDKGSIPISIVGGRENGFRTYSYKTHPSPGQWKVSVETQNGLVIGMVQFNVVDSEAGNLDTVVLK